MSKTGKRVFDVVEQLRQEDAIALTHRKASSKRQRQASLAARSQQDIQTLLVQVRILLQRALQQPVDSNKDKDKDKDKDSAVATCDEFLTQLLAARDSLLLNEPKSDKLVKKYSTLLKNNDEDVVEDMLQAAFVKCEEDWKSVLNQRHKDVRLHSGATSGNKFRALDKSFWEQVEQTVSHEQFMKSREEGEPKTSTSRQFDDSKVYQQMLKDFLSTSGKAKEDSAPSTTTNSGRGLTVRTVNKVDRRASKGRKLRYNVLPKLVNFTFPLSRPNNNSSETNNGSMMLEEDAWFKSLFGGAAASTVAK